MTGEDSPAQRWHDRKHSPYVPIDQCWRCQRARAHCRSKIRFATRDEAREWIDDLNRSRAFNPPMTHYRCRWCSGWHMTKATRTNRSGRRQAKRVEKQRRRWLIEQRRREAT